MVTPLQSAHQRHTVLVVDGDEQLVKSLRDLLSSDGHDVVTASSAEAALERLRHSLPCMALVDVAMPGLDGLMLCRRMKQDPRTADVPVALVTEQVQPADLEMGLAAGAIDYIKKPFDPDELRMRVRVQIRLHEALRSQRRIEKQLSVISSTAKDAIIVVDNEGAIVYWNEASAAMFGYAHSEVVGRNLRELLVPPRFREAHQQGFLRFRGTGEGNFVGRTLELVALHESGREFTVELSLSATNFEGNWCAVGIARDITERVKAEAALRESEQRYRAIFDAASDGIAIVDMSSMTPTYVNASWCQMFGLTEQEGMQVKPLDVLPPERRVQFAPTLESHSTGEIGISRDVPFHKKDGTPFCADVRTSFIMLSERPCMVVYFRDASERHHAEEKFESMRSEQERMEIELRHSQKLEAVGQLAAGIAHEINTPIQYVSDSVNFVREAFDGLMQLIPKYRDAVQILAELPGYQSQAEQILEAEEYADLQFVRENLGACFDRSFDGISRITNIVKAMKEFAHPDQREKSPADLNQALQSTITIARNEYKYVADLETDFGDLPPVICHLGDLNQVFLNLIVNAAHSISDVVRDSGSRGTIRVSTRSESDVVRIEIGDTGAGIPEPIRDRIFEPFFTTKAVGRGSGQGLAIARSVIVEKHRGSLTFRTAIGEGTTFVVRLPIDGKACVTNGERL